MLRMVASPEVRQEMLWRFKVSHTPREFLRDDAENLIIQPVGVSHWQIQCLNLHKNSVSCQDRHCAGYPFRLVHASAIHDDEERGWDGSSIVDDVFQRAEDHMDAEGRRARGGIILDVEIVPFRGEDVGDFSVEARRVIAVFGCPDQHENE